MPSDDSAVENAPRPVAVDRRYCSHPGSVRGGRTAAVLMSLEPSVRPGAENAPHAYLCDVLSRVSTHLAARSDDLLPDRPLLSGR
jgi:hypothetical protein